MICKRTFVLTVESGDCGINETSPLPSGTTGVAYQHYIDADGVPGLGPFTWTVTSGSLPPGLSMNDATWDLEGTPTLAGSYSFTLKLVTEMAECSKPFTMDVSDFDCLGNPPIETAVWAALDNPACSSFAGVGLSATYSAKLGFFSCNSGASRGKITLCNPGAPYQINIAITYAMGGGGFDTITDQISAQLKINNVVIQTEYVTASSAPGSFAVLTGTVPTGASNTVEIGMVLSVFPDPIASVPEVTGTLTIT